MPFDPTTAQPATGGFDPSTAKPVPKPTLMQGVEKAVTGFSGAARQGMLNGLLAQPIRAGMEALDNPVTGGLLGSVGLGGVDAQLKQKYPNQTQAWYDQQKHNIYGSALTQARTDAVTDTKNNPYPGHQIGNTFAEIAAQPEMLLMPGEGVGSTVVKRVASAAAKNAAVAGVSNAAAQVMDLVEGQKKNFDITQNLTQAAMGGALGGGIHGAQEAAPVVSDFVKGLFGNRGVDTKPAADPRGTTSPLTGTSPTLNADQAAQFKSIVKTGSVDDIKGFLADKQGPKPSWADVDNAVQLRDKMAAQPPGYTGQDNFEQAVGQHIDNLHQSVVQDHVDHATANWKNKPDIEVHSSADAITDPNLKGQVINEGGKAVGVLTPDDKVHLFADQIHSPEQANAVLYHEALGHFGLKQRFGDGLDNLIKTLMKRNVGQFGSDTTKWRAKNPKAYGGDPVRAGEEVLAEMSSKGVLKPSISDALASHFRRFGRKMGMKLSYSDAEVSHILAMAHDAVINGTDARGNFYRGALPDVKSTQPWNSNKFMFTGELANNFDPESATAVTGSDGRVRNEIDDSEAEFKGFPESGPTTLGEVLDHPKLYAEYPELKDIKVAHVEMSGLNGAYSPKTRRIYIDKDLPEGLEKDILLHETQHAVQDIENRQGARGEGNLNSSQEDYNNDPLEREANATGARSLLTEDQRKIVESPKFMTVDQLDEAAPKEIAEEAFERLGRDYVPSYKSQAEARQDAIDAGRDPYQIQKLRSIGDVQKHNFILDNAASQLNDQLLTLADKNEMVGLTANDFHDFVKAAAQFDYVSGRIDRDSTTQARALNSLKAVEFSRGNLLKLRKALEEAGTPLEALTDPENASKFLTQYKKLMSEGKTKGAKALMNSLTKPYWWQYALTWRNNMMLSAPSTHIKSTMDMATTAIREIEEKTLAAIVGRPIRGALRAAGAKGVQPGVSGAEVIAHLNGIARAAMDGQTWIDTGKALQSGVTPRFGSGTISNPRIPIVSKATDLIAAQDAFFRHVLTNGHLYALGTREAHAADPNAGLDNTLVAGAGIARNASKKMVDEAQELALNTMLMNHSALNTAIDQAKRIRPGMNGMEQFGSFVVNYLTPFIRVQSNALVNQIIRRSPVSFLDPVTRADWGAGGSRRDIAIARTMMGSALLGYYWHAAGQDKVTGEGPASTDKLKELEASGWRPGAVEENGRFNINSNLNISLNPLDLHNNTASLVAGARQALEEGGKPGQAALGVRIAFRSIMNDLTNQTFVSDIGKAYDAFHTGAGSVDKLDQFMGDQINSFLPNATTQLTKMIDPTKRDTSGGVGDIVKSAVPGLSQTVPAKSTVYGDDAKNGTSPTGVHTWFTRGNGQKAVTDPAEVELTRLGKSFKETLVTPVQRTISVPDTSQFNPKQVLDSGKVRLTSGQFEQYQSMAGKEIVASTRDMMNTPEWADMSDEDKAQWVRDMSSERKAAVREYLYGGGS